MQVEELAKQVREVTGHNVQKAYIDAGYTGAQTAQAAGEERIRLEDTHHDHQTLEGRECIIRCGGS